MTADVCVVCVADSVTDCCQGTAAGNRGRPAMVQHRQVRMQSIVSDLSHCSARLVPRRCLAQNCTFLLDNCCTTVSSHLLCYCAKYHSTCIFLQSHLMN